MQSIIPIGVKCGKIKPFNRMARQRIAIIQICTTRDTINANPYSFKKLCLLLVRV